MQLYIKSIEHCYLGDSESAKPIINYDIVEQPFEKTVVENNPIEKAFSFDSSLIIKAKADDNPTLKEFLMKHSYADLPTVLGFESPIRIQRRRHKKWRINKKWLKRYGYDEYYMRYKIDVKEWDVEKGFFGTVEYEGTFKERKYEI